MRFVQIAPPLPNVMKRYKLVHKIVHKLIIYVSDFLSRPRYPSRTHERLVSSSGTRLFASDSPHGLILRRCHPQHVKQTLYVWMSRSFAFLIALNPEITSLISAVMLFWRSRRYRKSSSSRNSPIFFSALCIDDSLLAFSAANE